MTILDRYFGLSDLVMESEKYFDDLINLFDKDAVLKPAIGERITGIDGIRKFYMDLFAGNSIFKHVWNTEEYKNSVFLKTHWIACGRRKSGEIFIFKGYDIAEINAEEKIINLEEIIETVL